MLQKLFAIFLLTAGLWNCSSTDVRQGRKENVPAEPEKISLHRDGSGDPIVVTLEKGKYHNHPTFAIWLEDTDGNYLQTLYVTQAIGKSIFNYGDKSGDQWKPGEVRRPAALPYWAHKRGVQEKDGLYTPSAGHPVPDAYTGATPRAGVVLETRSDQKISGKVNILAEVNQTWDWNEFWTNDKYPDDPDYKTSCQPSVIYRATLDPSKPGEQVVLTPIGHGHYAGKDGSLNTDLSTLTTALRIFSRITAEFPGK